MNTLEDHRRILEEVTRTSIELLLQEPFYSHFFATINKEIVAADGPIGTMAVGLRGRGHTLYVNPVFWDQFFTDKRHRYGVVKHEVLHIVLKHTLVHEPGKDRLLVNIAMDLVVNQYIDHALLPPESVFLHKFPELLLEQGQSWKYYYEKLRYLQENKETLFKDSESLATLSAITEHSHGMERHKAWKEIYTADNIDKSLMDADIDHQLQLARSRTNEKSYGRMPAGIRQYLDGLLIKNKPLVDWRRVVKLFGASSARTKVRNTLKRPSRRFGTNPGIKICRQQKLLVAIDTSGSIAASEVSAFFNEIHHLWRQGAEIMVVECDAKVQHAYPYKGQLPAFIKGGGGTDFNPPIHYGNTIFQPDALIYFTDGIAPCPQTVARFPILWVISSNGIAASSAAFQALPGRKARLAAD
ncbi:VWA-like domain-containing protein [Chitinophaga sp. Cy-1792]|uniref:vWA domain-containing protein n=1 Tax=Chitinophaga sp. Cy-1792 TaxID=2608339 RepID=UPI00141E1338|nr:VWA-like domain-containing protein [Chitinophaga sp. Cy-1792]